MTDQLVPTLTVNDCREAGYCVKGVRRRCNELGLDFRAFARGGFPFADVEHLDDIAVQRSLVVARKRIEMEAQHGQ